MTIILRPYQLQFKADIHQAWNQGAQNVLARLDTGGGKTATLGDIVREHRGASCIIAHRQELVGQLSITLARYGVRHNIIAAASTRQAIAREHVEEFGQCWYQPGHRCAIASVDTLIRAQGLDDWAKQVTLWVNDEAHHLIDGNKWHSAIGRFTHPSVRGLGPTATPRRADGKGLGRHADGVFDTMVHGPSMRWLIDNGYLTDYRIVCPPSDLKVLEEPGASGDWSTVQLRKAARASHIVGDVVQHYRKFAIGRLGATFCTDVDTAGEMAMAYNMAGVPAALLTGTTPDPERRRILRDFAARRILQLVTVDIVSEGFDLPALEVISMARPTQSLALYMQQFGRALRPSPGKNKALVIDHVSNTINHGGPPDRARVWSLDRRGRGANGNQDGLIPVRACVGCGQPFERFYKACPYCGTAIPEPMGRASTAQVEGDLIELDPAALAMLRGEVTKLDEPIEDYAQRLTFNGAQPAWVGAHVKRHRANQEAQSYLRDIMARWGGVQYAAGRTDAEIQRLFYYSFGTSVIEAMALPATDALAMATLVQNKI